MIIHATGFVNTDSGSVASANAVLLNHLLARDHRVFFYSKPTFVDPMKAVVGARERSCLKQVDCTNTLADRLRSKIAPTGKGPHGWLLGRLDSFTYNRGLTRSLKSSHEKGVDLWLGDWAKGRGARPVVSYVQGPPGTDAVSVFENRKTIVALAGMVTWLKLAVYATYRMRLGLPEFKHSDRIIVGSQWSRNRLHETFKVPINKIDVLPYPVDLKKFQPQDAPRTSDGPLRLLWVGRFAPRKRFDLFMDGLSLAIEQGVDVHALVIGSSAFVDGYEKLVSSFPYQERIEHLSFVSRDELTNYYWDSDVLAQPSEDENFGSSVAEALAVGIPVIAGPTNGTADYICRRSIVLKDYTPQTFADALNQMQMAKKNGRLLDPQSSRLVAEKQFAPENVTSRLEEILLSVNRDG